MKKLSSLIIIISIITLISCTRQDSKTKEEIQAAISEANTWLQLIDSEKYSKSWDNTAEYFKNAIAKEKWQETLKAVRTPLGKLISRKVKSKQYRTSLPGAPDGEYVIIQFKTSFENKKSAIETVTPMKNKDNKWRVSGYFIK